MGCFSGVTMTLNLELPFAALQTLTVEVCRNESCLSGLLDFVEPTGDWSLSLTPDTEPSAACGDQMTGKRDFSVAAGPDGVLAVNGLSGDMSLDTATCVLTAVVDYDWTNPSEYRHFSSTLGIPLSAEGGAGTYTFQNAGFCPAVGADVATTERL
jgi:hypothetical protein